MNDKKKLHTFLWPCVSLVIMTVTDQDVIKSHNIINNKNKKNTSQSHTYTQHNIEPDEKKKRHVFGFLDSN